MKYLAALLLSLNCATGFAVEAVKHDCHCQSCPCTADNHCGCYSGAGECQCDGESGCARKKCPFK